MSAVPAGRPEADAQGQPGADRRRSRRDRRRGARGAGAAQSEFTPAVSVRKSLASPDHILSMIDGKPYKSLKRHLSGHGLTPAEYRARYGLKSDYPMVAPGYSAQRREVAKRLGLGRKRQEPIAPAEAPPPSGNAAPAPQPKPRARRAKAEDPSPAQAGAKTPRRRKREPADAGAVEA